MTYIIQKEETVNSRGTFQKEWGNLGMFGQVRYISRQIANKSRKLSTVNKRYLPDTAKAFLIGTSWLTPQSSSALTEWQHCDFTHTFTQTCFHRKGPVEWSALLWNEVTLSHLAQPGTSWLASLPRSHQQQEGDESAAQLRPAHGTAARLPAARKGFPQPRPALCTVRTVDSAMLLHSMHTWHKAQYTAAA